MSPNKICESLGILMLASSLFMDDLTQIESKVQSLCQIGDAFMDDRIT